MGKVAKKVGKIYEKSGDETLMQPAEGYYTMREEARYLSKLSKLGSDNEFCPGSFEVLALHINC